jgi:hypothetical protein
MSKKVSVFVLAAVVAIFAIQAALAPATNLGVTPGQFNALKKRVSNLETYVAGCLLSGKSVAVARYDGYNYTASDGSQHQTSALDQTAGSSDQPQFYLLAVANPQCTTGTALHLHGLRLTRSAVNQIEAAIHKR